jgi:hypothetical protein
MSENLEVDKFRDGSKIPEAKSQSDWDKAIENEDPIWCYYNFNSEFAHLGKLYNRFCLWDMRGIAPLGFQIPSIKDRIGE